jgi:hypothetical protein
VLNFREWFNGGVSAAEVRAEVWRLGARHRGEPLRGALDELAGGDISPARSTLLRACVRELRRA